MTREFIMTEQFDFAWKELNLGDGELRELQEEILLDPAKGDVIKGTGGLRKIRFKYKGKGKRSGVRVLYVDFKIVDKIYLITAYDKGSIDDITSDEKKAIKNRINILKDEAMRKG